MSRQTVSNVLNAPELVSPQTRERVERAIARSGYRPSAAGRALRSRRSLTLALRLHPGGDINSHLADRFVHCLVEQSAHHGYNVTLFTASSLDDEADAALDLFHRRVVDAVVLTGAYPNDPRQRRLIEAKMPFGVFGRPWTAEQVRYPWADVDGRAGVRAATQYLFAEGYSRVGFIGWEGASFVGEDRLAGWRDVLRARGLDEAGWLMIRSEGSISEGAEAMSALLDNDVPAAVCASDSLAMGALEALRRRRAVGPVTAYAPVVGFDDTPVSQALGVCSVDQPVEKAAAHLVDRLVFDLTSNPDRDDTERGDEPPRTVLLAPTLSVRPLAGPYTTSFDAGRFPRARPVSSSAASPIGKESS